jgi:hypothetical protein
MSFKRTDLFGPHFAAFKPQAQGNIVNMVIDGKIDKHGLVAEGAELSELWSYIYVLAINNKDHKVFEKFRADRGFLKSKVTAKRFYKSLQEYSKHDVVKEKDLENFINETIKETKPINPIIEMVTQYAANGLVSCPKAKPANCPPPDNSFRDAIKAELKVKSDDVLDIIKVIRNLSRPPTPRPLSALAKKNCKDDIKQTKDKIMKIIESTILTKMCIIKYIGEITNSQISNDVTCTKTRDLNFQKRNFGLLTQANQDKIIQQYLQNKKSLMDIRNNLENLTKEISCDQISDVEAKITLFTTSLEDTINVLLNVFEDLNGSVRVYVRLRKPIESIDTMSLIPQLSWDFAPDNRKVSLTCNDRAFSGSFYGAFDNTYDNLGLYMGYNRPNGPNEHGMKANGLDITYEEGSDDEPRPWGLYHSFKQLESGYSIVMSGYGQSGSGKTYNLIGSPDDPGVVLYGLNNLKNVDDIEIMYVFELYYNTIDFANTKLGGKVILGYGPQKEFRESMSKYGVTDNDIVKDPLILPYNMLNDGLSLSTFINENMTAIQEHQRTKGRIKSTPNNNKSSRSHLFVVFKVGNGFFTLVDMAGQENCDSLYKQIFTTKFTLTYMMMQFDSDGLYKGAGKPEFISDYIGYPGVKNGKTALVKKSMNDIKIETDKIEKSVGGNVQILFESIYITESLNHLQYFYAKKNGITKKFQEMKKVAGSMKYETAKVFIQPSLEDSTSFSQVGKILIIPVMKFLEGLSTGGITKFITIAALRPDKCENIDVLKFAKEISSLE